MPVVLGLIAAALALLAASGSKVDPAGDSAGKAAPKAAKRPARRMSPQDAFEAGKKAREAELTLEAKAKKADDARIDAAVARRMKSAKVPLAAAAPELEHDAEAETPDTPEAA